MSVDYETRSNVDANVQNPFFGYKPANVIYNARIGIGATAGGWKLALVGRNIFDTITWNSAIAWGPPFISSQTVNARINPGRSIGLQLNVNF